MIYIASDHAGFELKKQIVGLLQAQGIKVEDCGPQQFDKDDDYPDLIYPCALKVAKDPQGRGIILGASGQGEAMVANKVKGIRAIVYYGGNLEIIKLSRQHNDSNILSLGARFVQKEVLEAVQLWLRTPFEGGRHLRRVEKMQKLEIRN